MKYLLQIYPVVATEEFERLPADEQEAIVEEYLAIGRSPGVIGGNQLQPAETATTLRVQDGETLLTDGPFVDAKEHHLTICDVGAGVGHLTKALLKRGHILTAVEPNDAMRSNGIRGRVPQKIPGCRAGIEGLF